MSTLDEWFKQLFPDFTEKHLEAIGWVAVEYAKLESSVTLWIITLTGVHWETGELLLAKLNSRAKIDLLSAILNNRNPDPQLKKDIEKVISKLERVSSQRNDILHSSWWVEQNPEYIRRTKLQITKAGHKPDDQRMTYKSIMQTSKNISEATRALSSLMDKYLAASLDPTSSGLPPI